MPRGIKPARRGAAQSQGISSAATKLPESAEHSLSQELQQGCLNVFQSALCPTAEDNSLLQEVKGHLYNRDFGSAFGKDEYLRVYASRWSPSRSLAYAEIFAGLTDSVFTGLGDAVPSDDVRPVSPKYMVCLGGGAGAELVGIAAFLKLIQAQTSTPIAINASFVDIASWASAVESLHQAATVAPELSKYAPAAAREANRAWLQPDAYDVKFLQADILNSDEATWKELCERADCVTLMFTLNELYTTSMAQTQLFLATLTSTVQSGAYLLVVDSPGSYSTVSIKGAERKYPMKWLLDHTLLSPLQQGVSEEIAWEKIKSEDSKWFRLPPDLAYPIELENMRYQLHLYRRLGVAT